MQMRHEQRREEGLGHQQARVENRQRIERIEESGQRGNACGSRGRAERFQASRKRVDAPDGERPDQDLQRDGHQVGMSRDYPGNQQEGIPGHAFGLRPTIQREPPFLHEGLRPLQVAQRVGHAEQLRVVVDRHGAERHEQAHAQREEEDPPDAGHGASSAGPPGPDESRAVPRSVWSARSRPHKTSGGHIASE